MVYINQCSRIVSTGPHRVNGLPEIHWELRNFGAIRASAAPRRVIWSSSGGHEMSLDNIEHVVVLMLENRSFDSMLGWLYENDLPALNIPATKPGDEYRGLQCVDLDKFRNTALNGTLTAEPSRGVQGFSVPDVAPGEEFDHINTQFYDTPDPTPDTPITMTGVLADFVEVLQGLKFDAADVARLGPMTLETFTQGQLPVLNQLAKHYAVSDAWYASVPSQTNPNRAFLMCATSNGMVNNGDLETNPQAKEIEAVLGMAIGDDRVDAPTIFNALSDAGVDWAVFFQTSYLPQKISTLLAGLPILIPLLAAAGFPLLAAAAAALLLELRPYTDYLKDLTSGELGSCYTWRLFPQIRDEIPDAAQHFYKLPEFHRLARAGQLPRFSYIEPFWSISHTTVDNPTKEKLFTVLGNDYHPPSNILIGEEFVKEVYSSLIANTEAWRKTLLLITFDEFVGSFDHRTEELKAGVVKPPWWPNGQPPFKSPTHFAFDRLGARVPTIIVSPYVQKETVFRSTGDVPYDHTSVIATTLNWLGQADKVAAFGARAQAAPTFEGALTLDRPRTDEAALPFLDTPQAIGDIVGYGDPFLLKNQNGQYLTGFYATIKVAGGGSIIPDSVMGICIDLDIAAYFPRIGGEQPAVLSFVTQAPDPASNISNGDQVLIVSRESGLGPRNLLGAWDDSHDCYYADEYLDGDNATKQRWYVQKLADTDQPVRYGDQVYLVNAYHQGARLTRDERWLVASGWITTDPKGDSWTIEPAPVQLPTVTESVERRTAVAPRRGLAAGWLPRCAAVGRGSDGPVALDLPGVARRTVVGLVRHLERLVSVDPDLGRGGSAERRNGSDLGDRRRQRAVLERPDRTGRRLDRLVGGGLVKRPAVANDHGVPAGWFAWRAAVGNRHQRAAALDLSGVARRTVVGLVRQLERILPGEPDLGSGGPAERRNRPDLGDRRRQRAVLERPDRTGRRLDRLVGCRLVVPAAAAGRGGLAAGWLARRAAVGCGHRRPVAIDLSGVARRILVGLVGGLERLLPVEPDLGGRRPAERRHGAALGVGCRWRALRHRASGARRGLDRLVTGPVPLTASRLAWPDSGKRNRSGARRSGVPPTDPEAAAALRPPIHDHRLGRPCLPANATHRRDQGPPSRAPTRHRPPGRLDRAGGEAITDYGVGSASAAPRMSLLPKVAGQEPSTSGGEIGLAVYSEAR